MPNCKGDECADYSADHEKDIELSRRGLGEHRTPRIRGVVDDLDRLPGVVVGVLADPHADALLATTGRGVCHVEVRVEPQGARIR